MYFLTAIELKRVLNVIEDDRDRLMVKVAYWHGLRASEVCALTGNKIEGGIVDVKRMKGSLHTRQPYIKHRDPLLDESRELTALAKKVGPKEFLFQRTTSTGKRVPMTRFNFNYLFKTAATKAGLPPTKRHPHCLKHSIAKATIKGAGIENTRQWLGHKSMSSTGAYLRVDDESAAVAIQALIGEDE